VPLDLALVIDDRGLPGGEFDVQEIEVVDAAVQTLTGQG
jgi:hypothetical protein